MLDKKQFWLRELRKKLDDAEIRQTIVISEAGPGSFRVVQEYELERNRIGRRLSLVKPSAAYRQDSLYETMDAAIQEAKRWVNKCCINGWWICRAEGPAGETIHNPSHR